MDNSGNWCSLYDDGVGRTLTPRFPDLLAAFAEAVETDPAAAMMYYLDAALSRADVARFSDAFAVALGDLGVRRGDRVALYLQNVPQLVIAMIGIWKAGAIAVLINPMNKEKELDHLLSSTAFTS
jgi:long-chain acyl-CoA synthetase